MMNEYILRLAKLSCSISESSTAKDEEFRLLIESAKEDLERSGVKIDLSKKIIIQAIILYVKANFGNTKLEEKEICSKRYSSLCNNLSLSSDYRS